MTALLPWLLACWPALADLHREGALGEGAALTCAEVAIRAPWHGVPPRVAVRQAWAESRFRRGRVSRAGAVGPLQVIPRYWCATSGRKFLESMAFQRKFPVSHRAPSPAGGNGNTLFSKAFSCDHVGAGLRALAYYRRTAGRCWWHRYTGRKGCVL